MKILRVIMKNFQIMTDHKSHDNSYLALRISSALLLTKKIAIVSLYRFDWKGWCCKPKYDLICHTTKGFGIVGRYQGFYPKKLVSYTTIKFTSIFIGLQQKDYGEMA